MRSVWQSERASRADARICGSAGRTLVAFVPPLVCTLACTLGCGGASSADGHDRVFYQDVESVSLAGAPAVEAPFPQLDAPEVAPLPEYVGVSLFDGDVHLSRPRAWHIRTVGTAAGRRFVVYASPRAYLFAVYERGPSSSSAWRDETTGYEDAVAKAGAQLLRRGVPMAVADAQGRSYVVRRSVAAAKGPLVNLANEYLIRGRERIVLVQIVHHEEKFDGVAPELRRVVETMEVR